LLVEPDYDAFAGLLIDYAGRFDCSSVVDGSAIAAITAVATVAGVGWIGAVTGVTTVVAIGGGVACIDDGALEVIGEAVASTTFRSGTIGSIFSGHIA